MLVINGEIIHIVIITDQVKHKAIHDFFICKSISTNMFEIYIVFKIEQQYETNKHTINCENVKMYESTLITFLLN